MIRKKNINIVLLIIGVLLFITAVVIMIYNKTNNDVILKKISGIGIGIGSALIATRLVFLYIIKWENKNPKAKRVVEIESKDERNIMILNKAKAKAGDIVQYIIIILAFILIMIDVPIWVIIFTVLVYICYPLLVFIFTLKNEKEM